MIVLGKIYKNVVFLFQMKHLDLNYRYDLSASFDKIVSNSYNRIHIPWLILNEICIANAVNTDTTKNTLKQRLLYSTNNLRLGRYLRNVHHVGWNLCLVRQHGLVVAICEQNLSFMDYTYLFQCSWGQCIWNCYFSLTSYTFKQVLTSNPWLPCFSSLPHFLTSQVSSYQS
jgi:hypothetical protein